MIVPLLCCLVGCTQLTPLSQKKHAASKTQASKRPSSAPATRRSAVNLPPPNPAEVGIPEGGNWKSVGPYRYNEYGASQMPAPWATHYHVYEKYPDTVRSARSQKTLMLQTKMEEIQAQLREVEDELEQRRKERQSMEKSYNKTRKANGLPPKRNAKKFPGQKPGRVRGRGGGGGGGGGGAAARKGNGAAKRSSAPKNTTVTISSSARDYLKNL